jgi:prolyl-tRNA synthetase
MRHSQLLIPTVKETPADAVVVSHRLMMRAGMIRKLAAGVYTYLPLATRVFQKVSQIVREEMVRAGAQEIVMPAVQPAELWEQSGRWQQYGPELLRFKDRKGADFCIGPTHEEVVTSLVRDEVKSYRQLPLNLFQIQTKFRDEVRPRFGLMRGREFLMKDAYSFDVDEAHALKAYDAMFSAYQRIFARCGLTYRPVEADTGSIGGNRSHEFQVLADTGEDAIVHCTQCHYAANVELAKIGTVATDKPETMTSKTAGEGRAYEKVATPGKKTIDDVASFLGVKKEQTMKSVLFLVDDKPVMALCRGDHDVNEVKLKKALGATASRMLEDKEIVQLVGGPPGYVGPIGAKEGVTIVVDESLRGGAQLVCGANEKDAHFVQVVVGRDFTAPFHDLRTAQEGDPCSRCGHPLTAARGIEVGHVFYLGTKYSKAMNAVFQAEDGSSKPYEMGCYGIGVTRTAAAAIEQNHDDDGIRWPAPIAPFHVSLVALGVDADTMKVATELEAALVAAGLEVLFDDRDERPGVKFKDHDLIGCPVRVAVGGKGLKEGIVEVKKRTVGKDGVEKIPVADAGAHVIALVKGLLADAERAADEATQVK